MNITLDSIKAEQTKLAEMIAAFEAQAAAGESLHFPEALIELKPGEHYAGVIVGKGGEASHHLILIAGEAESVTFDEAIAWAKGQGGELPTRREQSLLLANLKSEFKPEWYWSGEKHTDDAWAWYQTFGTGSQRSYRKGTQLRARAVRRLVIE
jgi:hypothetical protein